uniref:Uncharacterized protein n=1 Tax=Arundo donax TaxID=35708 RepID=A0A0A9DPC4_ARUDO
MFTMSKFIVKFCPLDSMDHPLLHYLLRMSAVKL